MKSLLVVAIMLLAATISMANNECDNVGEHFPSPDGCKICTCTEDHIITCTKVYVYPIQECIPGSRIPAGDGCNRCVCTEGGKIGGCTLRACPGSKGCKAGDIIPAGDGCNNCTCVEDGRVGHCTLFDCCEPGTTVPSPDGCNTCFCKDDGTIGGCTKIGCR